MSTASKNHIGRKISRIRELRDMKREALAQALGIAKALGVTAEGIKQFSEEAVFNIIGNTVTNNDNGALFNYYPTFNPMDKLIEAYEENKKLYERLLQAEKDRNSYLERLLEK